MTLVFFCLAYMANAQYYSVTTKINPVTFCNSSTSTSANIDIDCEGPCKIIVEYYSSRYNRWNYQRTIESDNYGNARYLGTGLRLNQTHNYRIYVYKQGTSVNRYKLNDSDYRRVDIYTKRICD